MISPREATLAVMGALRLARFDEKGTLFFNATVQGFWNSFWGAAIIAPLYFLEVTVRGFYGHMPDMSLRYVSLEIIMFAMSWVAFPLAMVYVCRVLGWSQRFLIFGVANNWADVVVSMFALPIQIAITLGALSGSAMSFMLALIIVYSLGLSWFVARHTLAINAMAATAVVVMSVFINFFIRYWGALLMSPA